MMTDKEKIRAEIERQIKKNNGSPISVCNDLLSYIDSLSEEPVSEDLENEIQRYYVEWDEHPQYVQTARHFANWQKEQLEKERKK